ncbi:MAG: HNH endonuclease [Rhizobiaceae bacterium]|nr:HNH endonuclease [Rhizobiaceae bacterium]
MEVRKNYRQLSVVAKLAKNLSPLVSASHVRSIDLAVALLGGVVEAASDNPSIRFTARATDGLWVSYQLNLSHFTLFRRSHLTVHAEIESEIAKIGSRLFGFNGATGKSGDYLFWRITTLDEVNQLVGYLRALPVDTKKDEIRKSRHITEFVKNLVFDRDEGRCKACKSPNHLQFDHIVPFSKGGGNQFENIQLLCQQCNIKKLDSFMH